MHAVVDFKLTTPPNTAPEDAPATAELNVGALEVEAITLTLAANSWLLTNGSLLAHPCR